MNTNSKDQLFIFEWQSNCFYWQTKAEQLKYSADILWAQYLLDLDLSKSNKDNSFENFYVRHDITYTCVMLAGFTLENLLKALIITNAPEKHLKDGILQGIGVHKLVDLAKKAGYICSEAEKQFCVLATKSIFVFGRYPTPLNARDIENVPKIDMEESKKTFDILYAKLHSEVILRFKSSPEAQLYWEDRFKRIKW